MLNKDKLYKYYLDTKYSVFIDESKYDIKVGKPLPLVLENLIDKFNTAAIVTAWNPRSQNLSIAENKARNIELQSNIKNYSIYSALGQGVDSSWTSEESYFILGITKEKAEILAVEYEQYAFIWCEREQVASLEFTDVWQ